MKKNCFRPTKDRHWENCLYPIFYRNEWDLELIHKFGDSVKQDLLLEWIKFVEIRSIPLILPSLGVIERIRDRSSILEKVVRVDSSPKNGLIFECRVLGENDNFLKLKFQGNCYFLKLWDENVKNFNLLNFFINTNFNFNKEF